MLLATPHLSSVYTMLHQMPVHLCRWDPRGMMAACCPGRWSRPREHAREACTWRPKLQAASWAMLPSTRPSQCRLRSSLALPSCTQEDTDYSGWFLGLHAQLGLQAKR